MRVLSRPDALERLAGSVPSLLTRRIDGRRCRTKDALLAAFARALAFPSYAGRNWDAFEECVNDLEWLPASGYLLIVTHAEAVLARDPEEYATLVAVLEAAGAEWARPRSAPAARPATPFHVVLAVTPEGRRARGDWRVPILIA